jgi:hypothetical protein
MIDPPFAGIADHGVAGMVHQGFLGVGSREVGMPGGCVKTSPPGCGWTSDEAAALKGTKGKSS